MFNKRNINPKGFLIFIIASAIFLFTPKTIFSQVVINEFLPNPSSGNNEWVELYNLDAVAVSLIGWLLEDNASHAKLLDSLIEIPANGFVVYEYTGGDGWLNNSSGDAVYLKDNLSTVIDSHSYSSDPGEEKSFGRSPDGVDNWLVFDTPSKNASNPEPTPTPTLTPISTSTLVPTPTNTALTPTPTSQSAATATPTKKPSSKPTPTKKPTIKPTPTPKRKATPKPTIKSLGETEEGEVAGEATASARKTWWPKLLLVLGSVILFGVAFFFWRNIINKDEKPKTDF